MGNLEDILRGHAKRHGIIRQIEAVGVVEAATREVERFILKEDFEIISFKEGTLKIGVDSSVGKNEIALNFSKELKKEHGIKRIRFEQSRNLADW